MKIDNLKSVKKTKVNTDITPVSLNKEIPKSLVDVDYSEENNSDLTKFFDDSFSNVNVNNRNNSTATFSNPLGGIQPKKKRTFSNELNPLKDIEIIPIEKSEFDIQLETYQNEFQKEIDIYSDCLKEVNKELKSIENARNILEKEANSISLYETRIEETIRDRAIEFQTMGLSEETQKSIGLTNEQAKNMNVDELVTYLEKHDDYTKEMLNGLQTLKNDLNEQVKELTDFTNYEEFNEHVMSLDNDKAILENCIHQLERIKRKVKYNMLANTEEFENFNSDKEYGFLDQVADDWIQDGIRYKNLLKTEDETVIKMYSYLYETEGMESASEYLNDIEEDVNQINAFKKKEEFIDGLSTINNDLMKEIETLKETSAFLENRLNGSEIKLNGKQASKEYEKLTKITDELKELGITNKELETMSIEDLEKYQKIIEEKINDKVITHVDNYVEKLAEDYKLYITDEKLAELELTRDKLYELTQKELIKIIKEKDGQVKPFYEEIENGSLNIKTSLEDIRTMVNTVPDDEKFWDMLANHLGVTKKGLNDGALNFGQGLKEWVLPDEGYTEQDYETMYILQELQDGRFNGLLDNNYELSQSMGNMVPMLAMNLLAPGLGTVGMGVSAGGNATHQALVAGADEQTAIVYGTLIGLSEACLEKLLGGISGLSDVEVVDLQSLRTSMGREAFEEFLQAYIEDGLNTGMLGEDFNFLETSVKALKSAAYGAVSAGVMNGTIGTVSSIQTNINSNLDIQSDIEVLDVNDVEIDKSEGILKRDSKYLNDKMNNLMEDYMNVEVLDVDSQVYQDILKNNQEINEAVHERFEYMDIVSEMFKFDLNTEFGEKVGNIFTNALNNENVPNSVKDILRNLDAINNKFDNFRIEEDYSGSHTAFARSERLSLVEENPHIVMIKTDVNSAITLHEFGHALLHIFGETSNSHLDLIETDSMKSALQDAKKNIRENLSQIENLNTDLTNIYSKMFQETVNWYNTIRESEAIKVRAEIEELYVSNDFESLIDLFLKAVRNPDSKNPILNILKEQGYDQFDGPIVARNEKELMIKVATAYHNIQMQTLHLNDIMSDYNRYGDIRRIIAMISSVVEGLEIQKEDGSKFCLKYGHDKGYYNEDNTNAFNELFADFFSLNANGRIETLNTFKSLVGDELYNTLNQQLNSISNKMSGNNANIEILENLDITEKITPIKDINTDEAITEKFNEEDTGEMFPLDKLEALLTNDEVFAKFLDFENNQDYFGESFSKDSVVIDVKYYTKSE